MICRDLQDNFYHPTKTLDVTFLSFFHFSKIDFAVEWQNKGTFSVLLIYHLMKYFKNISNLAYNIINSVQ